MYGGFVLVRVPACIEDEAQRVVPDQGLKQMSGISVLVLFPVCIGNESQSVVLC